MSLFFIFAAVLERLAFALGLIGLASSTVYSLLVAIAAVSFARSRACGGVRVDGFPCLSLLKPIHGDEPDLAVRLEDFFEQDYPVYEILFCARHSSDAGLEVARRVAGRYPHIPVQFLTTGEPIYSNAKVASLERMALAARHDIFVVSDSDAMVGAGYLRDVAAPFADPEVGLVTCLYRGLAARDGLWPLLEATAMSIEMTAGVLVAERIEGMKFALGPTMAVRRECVDEIGGFGAMGRYCADDFVLGNWIAARGHKVVLSDHVIDHLILNTGFLQSLKHQVRWMKSTRFSRPKGHFGTALTFGVPFGLLALAGAVGRPGLGFALFAWSILTRMMMAALVGGLVVRERHLWRTILLYPLRDLLGFLYWAASYSSNRILWRGETFELREYGLMRRFHAKRTAKPMSEETLTPPLS